MAVKVMEGVYWSIFTAPGSQPLCDQICDSLGVSGALMYPTVVVSPEPMAAYWRHFFFDCQTGMAVVLSNARL